MATVKLRKPTEDEKDKILKAARDGDLHTIQELASSGVEVTGIVGPNNTTSLHSAGWGGHNNIVTFLLSHGARVNDVDKFNNTPLHHAVVGGRNNIVTFLLSHGARVNDVDKAQYTALHYAVIEGHTDTVALLVSNGADLNMKDVENKTPLEHAVEDGHSEIVELLVNRHNMDINQFNDETQQKISNLLKEAEKKHSSSDEHPGSHDLQQEEVEKTALALALRDGKAKALGIKLLLFGAEAVGKTCVAATLVGDPFQECSATQGADIKICNASNWKKITKEEAYERLQNEYLNKLAIIAENTTTIAKAESSANKIVQGTSNAEAKFPLPKIAHEDIEAIKAAKTKGVTKVFKIRGGIDVTILDFAGQVQYHNTHALFIRKDNLIMVVFNASQPLSTNVKVRSSTLRKDPMTYSQNIHFWMKTVHSICREPGDATDKASLLPVIMLVATHLDLFGDSAEEAKEEIIQTLARELKGKPYARHLAGHREGLLNALRKYCIFLSNKVRDSNTIRQLQDVIIEVSFPILSKEHPLVYLNIERELLRMQEGAISIDEFHRVAHNCGFLAAIDSKEFTYAVEYFHHNGTVLNFASIESLRKLVVLSPHWLTKLLSYVLIAHPYKDTGDGRDISCCNLKQRGILLESFLSYMLDCFNDSGVTGYQIQQNEATDLMKWFGFLAQISPKTKILDKEVKIITQEKGLYVVPSLLPDDENDQKGLSGKDDKNVRIIYFHFPDQFLPPMLFNQVVAMCINRNEEKREDLIWLRKGKVKMVLDNKQQYCVSLQEEMCSIQLSFILLGKDSSAEHRYQLFQYLQSKLELLMNDFMQASSKPVAYVPCYYKDCHVLHVELQLVYNEEFKYCPTEDKCVPDDYYFDLFYDQDLWTQYDLEQMVSTATKEAVPLPKEIEDEVLNSVVVWLVTVNINETLATHHYLQQLDDKKVYKVLKHVNEGGHQTNDIVYYIGEYGACPAAISALDFGVHGSNLSEVTHELFPNLSAVISVGVAHGVKEKVKLCDVLVSSNVVLYDQAMVTHEKYLTQTESVVISSQLINVFNQFDRWPNMFIERRLTDNEILVPDVKFGTILSGSHLIDNPVMQKLLKNIAPDTIGIEMGGAHLFVKIHPAIINSIIVKAVCDFGDGNNKIYQPTAALLAADLVHKCLNDTQTLEIFSAKKGLRRMVQQAKNEGLTINVRHAKILFCGASRAGKTSFYRLLRNKSHKDLESTPVGHTKQVLVSGKVNVVGTSWVDLDSKLETEALTKRLIMKLQRPNDTDKNNSSINNVASTDCSVDRVDNKIGNNSVQTNKQTVDESPINSNDNTKPPFHTAYSNPAINSPQSNNPTIAELNMPNLELKENTPKNKSPVPSDHKLQVLTEDEMVIHHDYLNVPISELEESVPETWDLFTLLDTGGQPEFINMLPAINASTDITFVVLNLSAGKDCLDTPVIAQYRCEGYNYTKQELNYTNIDLLKCLFSSIKLAAMQKKKIFLYHDIIKMVKGDEHPQPIVCIIGTHADGLKEKLNDVTSYVNKKISELEVIKKTDDKVMVIWSDSNGTYLRPVDNTVPRNLQERSGLQIPITPDIQAMTIKTIEDIRDNSKKLLEKKMQYEIPISWFILELELRKFCEKNKNVCISLDDIKEQICNKIMPSDKRMEKWMIIEIMKFYHMFGTLLFFDEVEGMNEFVITDPQWLFTNLTKIVTCTFDDNHACYNGNHINKLRNEGICNVELLKNLNLNLKDIEIESFLKLLIHLKVIALKDKEHNEYFIPSVLPRCNRKTDIKIIFNEEIFGKAVAFTPDGHSIEVDPLLIEFTFGTIPRGLFGFLAVQILQDNKMYHLYSENDPENNIYYCCADLITFEIDPYGYVTLVDNISYLELQVRVQGNNIPSDHHQIQKTVTKALKTVCDRFDWQFKDRRYGFSCEKCFKNYSNKDHLSVLSTEEPIPSQFPDRIKCSRKHRMKLEEKHKIWFEDGKDILQHCDDKIIIESFDCSTVEENLRKEYARLSYLPYASMDKQLYAKGVITRGEKLEIESMVVTEQMAKLLDIIITSLKLKLTTKYLGFLKAMKESEDKTLQQTAKELATATISSRYDSSEPLAKKPKTELHNKDENDTSPNIERSKRCNSRDKSTQKYKETPHSKRTRSCSRSRDKIVADGRSRSRERKSRAYYSSHSADSSTSISKSRSPQRKGSSRKHKKYKHKSRSASKSRRKSKSPQRKLSSRKHKSHKHSSKSASKSRRKSRSPQRERSSGKHKSHKHRSM